MGLILKGPISRRDAGTRRKIIKDNVEFLILNVEFLILNSDLSPAGVEAVGSVRDHLFIFLVFLCASAPLREKKSSSLCELCGSSERSERV